MGLFDGIGGGNGGGGGLLGNLMDPLGLFSGGPKEKGLEKIIDPAGILGMVKGEVDKTQGNTGDQVKTAKEILGFLNSNEVQDLRKNFGDSGATSGQAPDPAKEPGTTEMGKSIEQQDVSGYANQSESAPVNAFQEELSAQQSASTAAPSDQITSTQSASTAVSEETRTEMKHLNTLVAYESTIDGTYGDHKFDRNNLLACLEDPNDMRFPPELQEACKYVLAHPDLLNTLINLSAAGNSCITLQGIGLYVQSTKQQVQGPDTGPTPGPTPAPVTNPHVTKVNVQPQPSSQPASSGGFDPGTYLGSIDRPVNGQPSTSLESAIGNMDDRLHSMETTMSTLTDDMLKGMAPNASPEDKLKGQAAEKLMSNLNLRYQALMNVRKQMYELLSNIHKTYSDMSMAAIHNIR